MSGSVAPLMCVLEEGMLVCCRRKESNARDNVGEGRNDRCGMLEKGGKGRKN